MGKVNLQRNFFVTISGVDISISAPKMVIETDEDRITITGADYDRLKAEIARHVNPALIMGKPIQGIDGDIYIGIRKRQAGL